jgi:hypothetical protein
MNCFLLLSLLASQTWKKPQPPNFLNYLRLSQPFLRLVSPRPRLYKPCIWLPCPTPAPTILEVYLSSLLLSPPFPPSPFLVTLSRSNSSPYTSYPSILTLCHPQSVMGALSLIYDTMFAIARDDSNPAAGGWFNLAYSRNISLILDAVYLSASSELVCGESYDIFKKNVQMQIGRGMI